MAKREYITVKGLIKLLAGHDQDRIVVLSGDGEGNDFSPLDEAAPAAYRAESSCRGEIGLERLTPELEDQGYDDEDVIDGVPALVLWPRG